MQCNECRGSGVLAFDSVTGEKLDCSACDGTGEVEQEDCITQFKRYREGMGL